MKSKITIKRQMTLTKEILENSGILPGTVEVKTSKGRIIITQNIEKMKIYNDLIKFLNDNNFIFKKAQVISKLKGGYVSETFLVNIDEINYTFKYLSFINSWDDAMDLEFIHREFNELQRRVGGPKIIFISNDFSLNEFAEGESAIKFLESSQVLSQIKKISVKYNGNVNQRMGVRFKKLTGLDRQPFLKNISNQDINKTISVLSQENYIIHGDLNRANIISNNEKISFIDFDTIMIAPRPMEIALIDIYEKHPTFSAWSELYGIKDDKTINEYIKAAAIYKLFEWNARNDIEKNKKFLENWDIRRWL